MDAAEPAVIPRGIGDSDRVVVVWQRPPPVRQAAKGLVWAEAWQLFNAQLPVLVREWRPLGFSTSTVVNLPWVVRSFCGID